MYFHGTADYPPGNSQGENQYYTPINEDGTPAPEFYGLLFWHEMAQAGGSQVKVRTRNGTALDAFAVAGDDGGLRVALINNGCTPLTVTVGTQRDYTSASGITLTAPGLGALSGVTLGGASVAADGTWAPAPQPVTVNGTSATIDVPAYTGAIVSYAA
jgi:hypothetical protein